MPADLIDAIYEASFVPDGWPQALAAIGRGVRAPAGNLLVFDSLRPVRFQSTEIVREINESWVADPALWQDSRRLLHYRDMPLTGFVIAHDYFPADLLATDSAALMRRRIGLTAQAGTIIPMPTGELIVYAFERHEADGNYRADDVAFLNTLHPHLARAGLIAARLGVERALSMTSAMQALGLPAAVLTLAGRALATNERFERLSSLFLPTALGGVAIAEPVANQLLQSAILRAAERDGASVSSIPVPATADRPPLVVHLLPLRRTAREIFSGGDLMVAVTTLNPSALVPSPTVLTGLFDLTPSEARLATSLCAGHSLRISAERQGIKFSTARFYLERIFEKTGTHQQTELVALLKSAHPTRDRAD